MLIIRDLAILIAIVNSPYLQSIIAEKCIEIFADTYNINLTVGDVYLKIPNQVILSDVNMKDFDGNQLLSANELNANVKSFNIKEKFIVLSDITLKEPYINAIIDENGKSNYSDVLELFSSEDTSKVNVNIICEKLSIEDGHLKFHDKRNSETPATFNATDIDIKNFNANFSNIKYIKDTLTVNINHFSLNEKSGIAIKDITTKAKYFDKGITLENLAINTDYSQLICKEISVAGEDSLYLSNPIEKIKKLEVDIDTLIFSIADLGPYLPQYKEIYDSIHVRGSFTGKLNDFKFKDFGFSMFSNTKLYANLSVDGFPDIDQTIVFGKISNMKTNRNDINRILKIISPDKPITIPSSLKNLDNIAFNGNITGMLNDMVAFGEISSNIGSIKTDIALLPDWKNKSLEYEGKISAHNFDLHDIISSPNTLGQISMSVDVSGSIDSTARTQNTINGQIQRFDLNGYSYSGINIKGKLSNTLFDGIIGIDDQNLQAEIIGKYNFGGKIPQVELSCDAQADLKALNLVPEGTKNASVKFVLGADISGDIIDRPIGNITLSQAFFNMNDNSIKIDKLEIIGQEIGDNMHSITAESDFLDINIYGDYRITEIASDVYSMLTSSIPSILGKTEVQKHSNNYLNFSFNIKRINDFVKFIDPELNVHGDISVQNGYVFCNTETLFGKISVPAISRGNYSISESEITVSCRNRITNIDFTTNSFNTEWRNFDKIKLTAEALDDNLGCNISWGGEEASTTSGFFQIDSKFFAQENDSFPRIEAKIHPSQFIFNESVWQLTETGISYDNKEIEIEDFALSNANQSLNVKGYISKDPEKILSFLIENVNIGNVNTITQPKGYEFGGILYGSGRISNIYDIPKFTANLSIDDLCINKENFGRFNISSKWENVKKAFVVSGSNKYLELKGSYMTEQDYIDASIMLKNLKLNIFDKYLNEYEISGVNGDANGTLTINGSIKEPELKGSISLKQTEFTYDYLKLKATTDDKIYIEKDGFYFDNFKVSDDNGHLGTINGGIYHNKFKDFKFGLKMNLDDYKIMDTKLSDNSLFYGTVYASGGVTFDGTPGNFSIYAGATTEAGSKFVLPMEDSYQAQNISYLTFVPPDNQAYEPTNIAKSAASSKYAIKLDIDVTPETEVQIVFDPKAGDRIKANGNGMLKIEYNSDEELYMYGEIEVSKGDYLFTLENIINKRFTITPGGTISWSGNPYEGKLNIDAVYSANVSLKELMREEYDTTDLYNNKTNVECHMHLNGNLLSPEIQFSINIPNANDKIKTKLASLTQDEINKQLLYVLVLNQFYDQNAELLNQTGTTTNAVGVTTTEMLSNQLSNWISKIVKDVDVGFKYSPGTEVSGREIEVALSTQIFNDRLLINGNLGISDKKYNNENLVGDVEVQWKLNKKGTLRLRGFSRKNTDLEAEYGPYTTGAGIFYTEEFDTFKEVVTKIWNAITFKQAREKRKAKKDKGEN